MKANQAHRFRNPKFSTKCQATKFSKAQFPSTLLRMLRQPQVSAETRFVIRKTRLTKLQEAMPHRQGALALVKASNLHPTHQQHLHQARNGL
jgi:hypothetical protein